MGKIVVGMSGGVDSAVTAYLLKMAGHEVIGVTLRTWLSADGKESRCCEVDEAGQTAWKLGIPYYVVNCISDFHEMVTRPFMEDYLHGLTPNPCVLCNRHIKWRKMQEAADVLGAELIATGHYASVVKKENDRYTVKKAAHAAKDQTYMLYRLSQEQLANTVMPLGKLSKDEVREIARAAGLPAADKADSQELCFVPDGNYAEYIKLHSEAPVPGEGYFIDEAGNVLGKHKGIICYTVGQRRGLGLAPGYPAYVKEIRSDENAVVIGTEKALYVSEVRLEGLHFMSIEEPAAGEEIKCSVKIRYHHPGQAARVLITGKGTAKVIFEEPVRAAAPGQSAVFYDAEDCVIGGGIIVNERRFDHVKDL